VLVVKDNQPALLARVRAAPDAVERVPRAYEERSSEHRKLEKGHGRIETRRCLAFCFPGPWEAHLWPGLQAIALAESTRETGDTVTTERRYYVLSLPADAPRIAHAVRAHWGIAIGMHRSLLTMRAMALECA
jgi:hypothetical protein